MDATGREAPFDWSHPLFAHGDLPVAGVSGTDAIAYCTWRSEHDGRPGQLPTEAEWPFAFGYENIKGLIQAVEA